MVINWIPLLSGLFFGLIPPRLLINSECRFLPFDRLWRRVVPKDTDLRKNRRRWWKLPLVWIDPARGFACATFLKASFGLVPHATGWARFEPLLATGLLLLIVLWMQTRDRIHAGETISPSSFLGGMMLALLPVVVACSAIVIGVATAIAMNSFAAGYVVATVTTLAIGYPFLGRSPWLPLYGLLVALPLVLNWLRRTTLVMPIRS